jgi:mannosyltransferase OCH1-like enzyme
MVNNIVENILPRNYILIKNNYQLFNDKNNEQYHIVCYFINNKKIQITVRRLDSENGWTNDLKIKLFDEYNKDSQIISIGSSDENSKIIELYTVINIVQETPINQLIPKVIMQTNHKLISNIKHYNSICSILEKNPEYEYIFFDDKRCREFLIENYQVNILSNEDNNNQDSDVVRAFDYILPGAIKADFFRYCYLYIKGGIYIDSKVISNISFNKLIKENDELILCLDDAPKSIYNGIIMTTKNNLILYEVIKECMKNIFNNIYLNDIHEPTGNKLLYKFFNNNYNNMKLKKKDEYIRYNNDDNKVLFISHYKDYYKENYTNFRDLWGAKNYYYKKIIKSAHYTFYINSNMLNDNFDVIQLKENIFIIKRIDTNKGWAQNLNIDALNKYTSIKKTINIGKSNENEKIFTVE